MHQKPNWIKGFQLGTKAAEQNANPHRAESAMLGQIFQLLHQFALDAFALLLTVLCGAPAEPPAPAESPEQAHVQMQSAASRSPHAFQARLAQHGIELPSQV
jgi:hypothetical protein